MIVYHGSTAEIITPDVSFSKRALDFGPGFYCTTILEQAERWAKRKAIRFGGSAIVNVYNLDIESCNYKLLRFIGEDKSWLDFICSCRQGKNLNDSYDIVIGGIADDDVFKTVDMYIRGIWDVDRTLQELRYQKVSDQICIVNQATADAALQFHKSYPVR